MDKADFSKRKTELQCSLRKMLADATHPWSLKCPLLPLKETREYPREGWAPTASLTQEGLAASIQQLALLCVGYAAPEQTDLGRDWASRNPVARPHNLWRKMTSCCQSSQEEVIWERLGTALKDYALVEGVKLITGSFNVEHCTWDIIRPHRNLMQNMTRILSDSDFGNQTQLSSISNMLL